MEPHTGKGEEPCSAFPGPWMDESEGEREDEDENEDEDEEWS